MFLRLLRGQRRDDLAQSRQAKVDSLQFLEVFGHHILLFVDLLAASQITEVELGSL